VIGGLRDRIHKLMEVAQQVRKENEELKALVGRLQSDLRTKVAEQSELRERYQRLKMSKTFGPDENSARETKLQVTRIVREIDKCIALLNR